MCVWVRSLWGSCWGPSCEILGDLGNRFSQAHPASFHACYVQEVLKVWPRAGLLPAFAQMFQQTTQMCARSP